MTVIRTTVGQKRLSSTVAGSTTTVHTQAIPLQDNQIQGKVTQVVYAGQKGDPGQVATFSFSTPAATWTVRHNLGRNPEVQVLVGEEEVIADVEFPDVNTVVVTHSSPRVGSVQVA